MQHLQLYLRLYGCVTSVVDICGNLYVTLLYVDWQFIKMFVFLQCEFSTQWDWIPILIHSVDQHGVIIVKLQKKVTVGGCTCILI